MKAILGRRLPILLILLLALVPLMLTAAASADYEVAWWSTDGGGGTSTGGDYILISAIGQPDVGVMQGGEYSLASGLLGGGAVAPPVLQTDLFLPLVVR